MVPMTTTETQTYRANLAALKAAARAEQAAKTEAQRHAEADADFRRVTGR